MGVGWPSGTVSMEQGIKKAGQVGRDAFVCFMSLPPTLKGEDRLLPFVASLAIGSQHRPYLGICAAQAARLLGPRECWGCGAGDAVWQMWMYTDFETWPCFLLQRASHLLVLFWVIAWHAFGPQLR